MRFDRVIVTPNTEENKKNQVKQKTEIEFELKETVVYSRAEEKFDSHCSECGFTVEMATPQIAAILSHLTEREIYRLVETAKVHFVESDKVLICLNSLKGTEKSV